MDKAKIDHLADTRCGDRGDVQSNRVSDHAKHELRGHQRPGARDADPPVRAWRIAAVEPRAVHRFERSKEALGPRRRLPVGKRDTVGSPDARECERRDHSCSARSSEELARSPYAEHRLMALRRLAEIDAHIHAPPVIEFSWSGARFQGVITSFTEKFTIFDDRPHRARARPAHAAELEQSRSALPADESTIIPDRTKTRVVRAGERLDMIAAEEYGDPAPVDRDRQGEWHRPSSHPHPGHAARGATARLRNHAHPDRSSRPPSRSRRRRAEPHHARTARRHPSRYRRARSRCAMR